MSSRLPVSQFDLVSPRLEKRQKKRRAANATTKPVSAAAEPPPILSLDAEFWELQQNVTMLKRRLKLYQSSSQAQSQPSQQQQQQSGLPRELIPTESLDTEEVFNFTLR